MREICTPRSVGAGEWATALGHPVGSQQWLSLPRSLAISRPTWFFGTYRGPWVRWGWLQHSQMKSPRQCGGPNRTKSCHLLPDIPPDSPSCVSIEIRKAFRSE